MNCIFRAKGNQEDTENARLAVDGLKGKVAGIVLKRDRKKMLLAEIVKYTFNKHVFGMKDTFRDKKETLEYGGVAEVWY